MLDAKLIIILLLAISNTLRVIHNSHQIAHHMRHFLHNQHRNVPKTEKAQLQLHRLSSSENHFYFRKASQHATGDMASFGETHSAKKSTDATVHTNLTVQTDNIYRDIDLIASITTFNQSSLPVFPAQECSCHKTFEYVGPDCSSNCKQSNKIFNNHPTQIQNLQQSSLPTLL